MADAIVLTLPEPPSANRYWRQGRGRLYRSKEANAFRDEVFVRYCRTDRMGIRAPMGAPVSVSIDWYRGRRAGDLDNRCKCVLDALQGIVYHNDSQVVELHMYRKEDKANPRVVVTARALEAVSLRPTPAA